MDTPLLPFYLKAARCEPLPRPPIWMMRQAGRYLPEYRKIREKYHFLTLLQNPEIAAEITLQPIRRFEFDAAILFSDILTVCSALGSPCKYIEHKGPIFYVPIETQAQVNALQDRPILETIPYVIQTIKILKSQLASIPLIGFCGGPFTIASYMIEGHLTHDLHKMKHMMYTQPQLVQSLLEKISCTTIDYLNEQIRAGVNAIQIFDTWAGQLSWEDFEIFSTGYIRRIIEKLDNPNHLPITIFTRGGGDFIPLLCDTKANVISLDWSYNLLRQRQVIPQEFAVQGNLDPFLLYAPKELLKERVLSLLNAMENERGFIFNLGHGIRPDVNPDSVHTVVDVIKTFSKK